MKLRNKKTGEIGQIGYAATSGGEIIVEDISGDEYPYSVISRYKTLSELNEEWKDYKPAEPLIKDEKIRKAVRAWAEIHELESVFYFTYTIHTGSSYLKCGDTGVVIDIIALPELEDGEIYTIAELCGEEEE